MVHVSTATEFAFLSSYDSPMWFKHYGVLQLFTNMEERGSRYSSRLKLYDWITLLRFQCFQILPHAIIKVKTKIINFWYGPVRGNTSIGMSTLELVKLAKLKVIRLKRAKMYLHKVSKFYRRLYCEAAAGVGGQVSARTIQMYTRL